MATTANATLVFNSNTQFPLDDWDGNLPMTTTIMDNGDGDSQLYLQVTNPNDQSLYTVQETDEFRIDIDPPTSFGVSITVDVPPTVGDYTMTATADPDEVSTPDALFIPIDKNRQQTGVQGLFSVPQTGGDEYSWEFTTTASPTSGSESILPADPKLIIRNIKK